MEKRPAPRKNRHDPQAFEPVAGSTYHLDPAARFSGDFIEEEQRRRAEKARHQQVRPQGRGGGECVGRWLHLA